MGHDHHFLSRLDRVSREQVDFALSLYREHERTQWILDRARLPGEPARVALAIEEGPRSPHVIVTREGHFVTCLGAGMTTGTWPVVTRAELDGLSREHATQTERFALRQKLEQERRAHGTKGDLFDRILYGGPSLSREELSALAAFAPLMTHTFCDILLTASRTMGELVLALAPVFTRSRKSDKLTGHDKPLEAAGRAFWTIQHAMVLYAMHAGEGLEARPPEHADAIANALLSMPIIGGLSCAVLRAAWALANIGPLMWPACKRRWETTDSVIELTTSTAAMVTLALRYPDLEPEARAALTATREGHAGDFVRWLGELALTAFDPATLEDVRGERRVEQVIDESVGEWAITRACLFEEREVFPHLFGTLPFFARAQAEQLYLPRERAKQFRWDANDTCWLLARQHEASRAGQKYRATLDGAKGPPPPLRNRPCACGSGKKYKRCCGARA
jgi:hypothetical protein